MNRMKRNLVSRGRVNRKFFIRIRSGELQGDTYIPIYNEPISFTLITLSLVSISKNLSQVDVRYIGTGTGIFVTLRHFLQMVALRVINSTK